MQGINLASYLGLKTTDCIKDATDSIYLIDGSCHLEVKGSNVTIIDVANDCDIDVLVDENSTLNYIVLNSRAVKRHFRVYGNMNYTCISLASTSEPLNVELLKREASCDVNVLSIASAFDSKFIQRVDHKEMGTKSNVKNVCVAYNKSNITFDTTGFVEKGKSGCLCSQLSRGVVMDDESSVTAKPILLIDEFDCFANHGASIGKVSDEDLFYLMSRGLSKNEAFLLILKGIIRPFIEGMPTEELKNAIDTEISNLIEK